MKRGTTNENLRKLIISLKKTKKPALVAVAEKLEKPSRKRAEVNLFKIQKYAKEEETVVVPGKVLSEGNLSKKVTIAAYQFSKKAKEKIEKNGSKAISLEELVNMGEVKNLKIIQ